MQRSISLWTAALACCGCLFLGAAATSLRHANAQAPAEKQAVPAKPAPEDLLAGTDYPYLPPQYGQPYLPTVADWQSMRVNALGASTTRITEHFERQHLTCFVTPKGLLLTLDLLPMPSWKHYAGGGKFAVPVATAKPDLQQAVDASVKFLRNFFPEVKNEDVSIRVYIRSEHIGAWENGALTLNAEKPAAAK